MKSSASRFELLSDEAKSFLVFEEVLALERELIPRHEAGRPVEFLEIQEAYRKHLRLLVTQYSKGWFPRWIIENYFSVSVPPLNYWEMFRDSNKVVRL